MLPMFRQVIVLPEFFRYRINTFARPGITFYLKRFAHLKSGKIAAPRMIGGNQLRTKTGIYVFEITADANAQHNQ
jgi:hypothetical protein